MIKLKKKNSLVTYNQSPFKVKKESKLVSCLYLNARSSKTATILLLL